MSERGELYNRVGNVVCIKNGQSGCKVFNDDQGIMDGVKIGSRVVVEVQNEPKGIDGQIAHWIICACQVEEESATASV